MMAIAAVSLCVMVSCGNKENKDKENNSQENTEQVKEVEASGEEAVVKMLQSAYEDFNTIFTPQEDDMEVNLDLYGMYCSEEFNEMINQVRAAEANLDDPEQHFFQESDLGMWSLWEDNNLTIDNIDVELDGETGYATYILHHGDETEKIGVTLVFENDEWRIDDFSETNDVQASMHALMDAYLQSLED